MNERDRRFYEQDSEEVVEAVRKRLGDLLQEVVDREAEIEELKAQIEVLQSENAELLDRVEQLGADDPVGQAMTDGERQ